MKKIIVSLLIGVLAFSTVGCGTGGNNSSLEISGDVDFGNDDYNSIISANNGLGFSLLKEAEPDSDGNIFISPFSLFMALSMTYNGADDVTMEEMAAALGVTGMDAEQLNKANASLMSILHSHAKEVEINVANSIWINQRYHFQDDFSQSVQDYYNAKIEEINVSDSESVKTINNWVKDATNGKIEDIVEAPLNPDTVSILINAIYFKGDWLYQFDKKQTEERSFYLGDGKEKKVPLMRLSKELSYLENEDFQAVSLPYKGEKISMKVFLPKNDTTLDELQNMLTNENWEKWLELFNKKEGTVLLPKFKLEYETELNDTLKKLGMESAFHEGADFTKMIVEPDPIWIDKVKQKTYIDVNEEGTEAAAVTSVEIVTESAATDPPFYMEVNKPFFIALTDDETGAILFMGKISNP